MTTEQQTAVTQSDKDAAVDLAHALEMTAEYFTSGVSDTIVQAFRNHRLASQADQGEDARRWKAALHDIEEAEAIPNVVAAFMWCRDIARAALAQPAPEQGEG